MVEYDGPAVPNKNTEKTEQKWTAFLAISAFVCCIGSAFPAGYNMGVVNNAAYPMMRFLNNSIRNRTNASVSFNELNFYWSSIVSIFLVGGVVGSLSAGYLADRYGRKGALMIGNATGIIGGITLYCISVLNAYELFWIGRIFAGFSGGLATSLVPMYVTEIAPINLRGALGVTCQLGITIGILVSQILGLDNIMGTDESWPLLLFLFAPLCFMALLITIFLPESPKYFYVRKQCHELAFKELSRLRNRRISLLKIEIEFLNQEAMINSKNEFWSIWQVFRARELRVPLFLVCLIQCGQQFSGINTVFYYSVEIFVRAGINMQLAQIATICVGFANFLMALVDVYLLSRFGRKIILLTSCYIALTSMTVLCIAILFILSILKY